MRLNSGTVVIALATATVVYFFTAHSVLSQPAVAQPQTRAQSRAQPHSSAGPSVGSALLSDTPTSVTPTSVTVLANGAADLGAAFGATPKAALGGTPHQISCPMFSGPVRLPLSLLDLRVSPRLASRLPAHPELGGPRRACAVSCALHRVVFPRGCRCGGHSRFLDITLRKFFPEE